MGITMTAKKIKIVLNVTIDVRAAIPLLSVKPVRELIETTSIVEIVNVTQGITMMDYKIKTVLNAITIV
jgi:hypothetical protein